MQHTFTPTEQPQPDLKFKSGNPEYDKAFRVWRLIEALSQGVYGGEYQDFNVYYSLIFNNLNQTIDSLNPVQRRTFDEVTRGFRPEKIKVLTSYSKNEETELYDVPVYEDRDNWEGLLLGYVVDAGGWAYVPNYPVVPFVNGKAATYHMAKLEEAHLENCANAEFLIKELSIEL